MVTKMSDQKEFSQSDLDSAYDDSVRAEAVKIVYSIWFSESRTMKRAEIMEKTIAKIKQFVKEESWKNAWGVPKERAVGRRIDEACTVTPYSDLTARLEEVTKGVYRPNMERFEQ